MIDSCPSRRSINRTLSSYLPRPPRPPGPVRGAGNSSKEMQPPPPVDFRNPRRFPDFSIAGQPLSLLQIPPSALTTICLCSAAISTAAFSIRYQSSSRCKHVTIRTFIGRLAPRETRTLKSRGTLKIPSLRRPRCDSAQS